MMSSKVPNHNLEVQISCFKLPKNQEHWISAISRANLVVAKYTAVCRNHCTENGQFKNIHKTLQPVG